MDKKHQKMAVFRMVPRNLLILILFASYALLAACGQTGPLYLPCDSHDPHCLPNHAKKVEKYR